MRSVRPLLAAALLVGGMFGSGCGSTLSPAGDATPSSRPPAAGTSARPHVLVIVEENVGYGLTLGSCGPDSPDPYLCSLAARYASVTGWFGVEHPSEPNYIDLVSGGDQGCHSDGCAGPYSAPDLGAQFTKAGVPWVALMESMPSPCYRGAEAGEYAAKHNPFVVFGPDLRPGVCQRVLRTYAGAGTLVRLLDGVDAPDFVWITPNLIDDMHDGTIQQGDYWLKANVAPVLGSRWFAAGGSIVITMDESDTNGSAGCCGDARGGQVPEVIVSSASLGKGSIALTGDHFGTLRSIEEAYHLPLLGKAADARNGDISSLLANAPR